MVYKKVPGFFSIARSNQRNVRAINAATEMIAQDGTADCDRKDGEVSANSPGDRFSRISRPSSGTPLFVSLSAGIMRPSDMSQPGYESERNKTGMSEW